MIPLPIEGCPRGEVSRRCTSRRKAHAPSCGVEASLICASLLFPDSEAPCHVGTKPRLQEIPSPRQEGRQISFHAVGGGGFTSQECLF